MESNVTDTGVSAASAQLHAALRKTWDTLVIGMDTDSGLLQLPALQLRCLRRIAQEDGQRLVDIAQRMQMPLSGVSRLVDRLVRQGMVSREPDTRDRRAVRLSLTSAARSGLAEIEGKRLAKIASCLRHLDPATINQLLENLRRLCAAAEHAQAAEPPA